MALNSSLMTARLVLKVPFKDGSYLVDWFQPECGRVVSGGKLILELKPYEGRVLYFRGE